MQRNILDLLGDFPSAAGLFALYDEAEGFAAPLAWRSVCRCRLFFLSFGGRLCLGRRKFRDVCDLDPQAHTFKTSLLGFDDQLWLARIVEQRGLGFGNGSYADYIAACAAIHKIAVHRVGQIRAGHKLAVTFNELAPIGDQLGSIEKVLRDVFAIDFSYKFRFFGKTDESGHSGSYTFNGFRATIDFFYINSR